MKFPTKEELRKIKLERLKVQSQISSLRAINFGSINHGTNDSKYVCVIKKV